MCVVCTIITNAEPHKTVDRQACTACLTMGLRYASQRLHGRRVPGAADRLRTGPRETQNVQRFNLLRHSWTRTRT